MIREYSQEQILRTYQELRAGTNGVHTPLGFAGKVAEQVVDISAQELVRSTSTPCNNMVGDVLFAASEELIRGIATAHYDRDHGNERYIDGDRDEVIRELNTKPGELDKKYLPRVIEALGLVADNSVGVMNIVGFDFFIKVITDHIEEVKTTYSWDGNREEVAKLSQIESEKLSSQEYAEKLMAKLDKTLGNTGEVSTEDAMVATAGLYLANYLWQIAFATKYTVKEYFDTNKNEVLQKFQSERDFTSFDNMIQNVYSDLRKNHDINDAIILTAFKLFQDAAEYIDLPAAQ